MRLPFSKVWRSFAELDVFSDTDASRFVDHVRWSAVGWGVMAVQIVFTTVLILAGAFPAMMLAAWLVPAGWAPVAGRQGEDLLIPCMAWIVHGVVSVVAGLMVRDGLLRCYIRSMLNAVGSCGQCRYPLLGLHVAEDLKVRCPECGQVTRVDGAIAALAEAPRAPAATK